MEVSFPFSYPQVFPRAEALTGTRRDSHTGDAFFVAHNDRFINEVLPTAFGHSNVHSFTRAHLISSCTSSTAAASVLTVGPSPARSPLPRAIKCASAFPRPSHVVAICA